MKTFSFIFSFSLLVQCYAFAGFKVATPSFQVRVTDADGVPLSGIQTRVFLYVDKYNTPIFQAVSGSFGGQWERAESYHSVKSQMVEEVLTDAKGLAIYESKIRSSKLFDSKPVQGARPEDTDNMEDVSNIAAYVLIGYKEILRTSDDDYITGAASFKMTCKPPQGPAKKFQKSITLTDLSGKRLPDFSQIECKSYYTIAEIKEIQACLKSSSGHNCRNKANLRHEQAEQANGVGN